MPDTKIEVSIGSLKFSGEGNEEWLEKQLDKILEIAPSLSSTNLAVGASGSNQATQQGGAEFTTSLSKHIAACGGASNQVKRFLSTADWLRRRGLTQITTAAVSKALSDNQQKRLSNPADCLNKNVAKGFCEKKGDGFFITPDGLQDLGYSE